MSVFQRRWTAMGVTGCLAAAMAAGAITLGMFGDRDARADDAPADAKAADKSQKDPAVERAREQVQMLDALYKNAVVSITERYVASQDKQPAIMVAKDIFGAMKKGNWHSAKLVDATGDPMGPDNAPKTAFEKDAAKAMNAGQPYFDRVVGEGKDARLLAATVVPVVMRKCAECHDKKVGEVLGFIRYDVPIK